MKAFLKKAGLGVVLGATAIGFAAAPAEARRWHGGHHHYHHGDRTGAALVGGIIGLGIGAAIASSNNDRYYRDRYYRGGYYDDGYYAPRAYYDYRPRCWTEWNWDPYWGRDVRVRVCR